MTGPPEGAARGAGPHRAVWGGAAMVLLAVVTAANLALGKTFAYLRVGPVYVGEIALVLVALCVLLRGRLTLVGVPVPLLLLLGYTGVQVGVEVYQRYDVVEILRGWSVVYYALFGILASSAGRDLTTGLTTELTTGPAGGPGAAAGSDRLVRWLCRLTVVALAADAATAAAKLAGMSSVVVLGARVALFKPTDASIVAILAVVLWLRRMLPTVVVCGLAFPVLAVAAAQSRSVLVSLALVAVVFCGRRRLKLAVLWLLAVVLLCALVNLRITTGYREISVRQLALNATSVIGAAPRSGSESGLAANRSWRLDWWRDIAGDSVRHTRAFAGLGWHTNLADEYGFQTAATATGDQRLRHPHNAAMGILGRGGWIPLLLWTCTYLALLARLRPARRALVGHPPGVLVDLALAALCAGLVDGLTDVFLEAPQDAIPHWTIIGVGLAVARGVATRPPAPTRPPAAGRVPVG